jgi:hypothetical protein
MERVIASLSVPVARDVLRGVPLDVTVLSDHQVDTLVTLSLHCMLNGPVGVNKVTTFPLLGEGSIKTLLGVDVSNGQWKATVLPLAEHISSAVDWQVVLKASKQYKQTAKIWPINDP